MTNRLAPLDWLRGLLAVSIMTYHLTGWTLSNPNSDDLLGRLGIYGVSMFFILSGLAMAEGYSNFIRSPRHALVFFLRRIFRIWPLLWLAVFTVVVGSLVVKGERVDWLILFLNLTTLFGFVNPGAYINTGAWSIGNEMVYYAMTPLFLATYNYSLRAGNSIAFITGVIAMYFAYQGMSSSTSLESQWLVYINPFNNLFLFVAGIAIHYNMSSVTLKNSTVMLLLCISVLLFSFYPAEGDLIALVTGSNRFIFCSTSIIIVLAFYKLTIKIPHIISRPLSTIGEATYGIYLLHPIIFSIAMLTTKRLSLSIEPTQIAATTAAVTIILALLTYKYFELPLIHLGKRLTS